MTQTHLALFFGLLLLSVSTKFLRIQQPDRYYFDEVYHGYTAQQMVKGNPDVYDPWAKPPPKMANEWTHPPLGKLIVASGIQIFGDTWFGMRASSAFFGVGVTILVFLLALLLFQHPPLALLAMFFASIDGLILTQSRITTIDIHFSFFLLCSFLLYTVWRKYRPSDYRYLLAIGVTIGLAVATKWIAFYLIAFLGTCFLIHFVKEKKHRNPTFFILVLVALFGIPSVIYMLAHLQYFFLGFNFKNFVELQRQMWFYHTGLKATHSFQSQPWQWLLDLRPVWFHVTYIDEKRFANIYNLANPILCWAGLIAAICLTVKFFWKEEKRKANPFRKDLGFLLGAYYMFWVPWTLSPRIMFSYHYLTSLIVLTILLAYSLIGTPQTNSKVPDEAKKRKQATWVVASLAFLWFVVFFPHLTAIPVNKAFAQKVYFAIPTWK